MQRDTQRILITGGTGLIGRTLADHLAQAGYEVVILSRNPVHARGLPPGQRIELWDARTANGWGPLVNGAAAIVNLAGASIGIPPFPWTAERKKRIHDSRVNAGHAVVDAIKAASDKPRVLIQSSAVGYYGLHGDEVITEDSNPGTDFLSRVCVDWENSTAEVESLGVRRVIIRTGHFLSRRGGILTYLALPFRFFFGGPIGSGHQWMPWIHSADHIGAIHFLIENENVRGPFNLAAPHPVTNAEMARALGKVLHRPAFVPTPGFAMKLALGEMAELLLLGGQRVVPQGLLQAGYPFQFRDVEPALRDLLTRHK